MMNKFNDRRFDIKAVQSRSGKNYLRASVWGRSVHISCDGPHADPRRLLRELAAHDIGVPSPNPTGKLQQMVDSLANFESRPNLLDRHGWNDADCFALPNGRVITAQPDSDFRCAAREDPTKGASQGTLAAWKREVASPLTGNPIAMMAMLIPFAAPLIALFPRPVSLDFELVGPPSAGLDLAQCLASSVSGSPAPVGGQTVSFALVIEQLEPQLALHSDMAMIVSNTDVVLTAETPARRIVAFKQFLFRGQASGTAAAGAGNHGPCMTLSIGTCSMRALLGAECDLANHADGRLLTIIVGADRPYGLFEGLPDDWPNVSALAARLRSRASTNHGVALPAFLRRLIEARGANEGELRSRIDRLANRFREHCGVDCNDPAAVHGADAFGLLYAGGVLARTYGILPRHWRIGPAALAAYRNLWQPTAPKALIDRLEEIASKTDVVHLTPSGPRLRRTQAQRSSVLVKHKSTGRELLIKREAIKVLLPDWRELLGQSGTKSLLTRDGQHLTTKRRLAKKSYPVFCFNLPLEAVG